MIVNIYMFNTVENKYQDSHDGAFATTSVVANTQDRRGPPAQ